MVLSATRSKARLFCVLALSALLTPALATAQDDAFADGWTLQSESSALRFQSVKNSTKVETSSFATFNGGISEDGLATINILMDSVDTKVDLRNVRMRFLFFETFQYPEAKITVKLDSAMLNDLAEKRRLTLQLPYTLDLHGVSKDAVAEVAVTLVSPDIVAVSSVAPISVAAEDFNLSEGIIKLQEAANVEIIPSGTVTFDFLFGRNVEGGAMVTALADGENTREVESTNDAPVTAALETSGNFDEAACIGRFEILSRAGNIYFRSGSASLDAASNALLDNLYDIVRRCPGMIIEVGGHTDSDGPSEINLNLSRSRAQAVADYLEDKGVESDRMFTRGYGEETPVVPNTTADNKRRNRRIEFKVVGG